MPCRSSLNGVGGMICRKGFLIRCRPHEETSERRRLLTQPSVNYQCPFVKGSNMVMLSWNGVPISPTALIPSPFSNNFSPVHRTFVLVLVKGRELITNRTRTTNPTLSSCSTFLALRTWFPLSVPSSERGYDRLAGESSDAKRTRSMASKERSLGTFLAVHIVCQERMVFLKPPRDKS